MDRAALERQIHDRVNEVRRAHGRSVLKWSHPFHPLARIHSREMASRGFFHHVDPEGKDINDRAEDLGLQCEIVVENTARNVGFGENLYMASLYHSYKMQLTSEETVIDSDYDWKTPDEIAEEVVQGWLHSPGHRENLLSKRYRRESIGVAIQGLSFYVTQVFC